MPPPPSTPSPRRFIVTKKDSTVKQLSRLRFSDGLETKADQNAPADVKSTQQFVEPPRFSVKPQTDRDGPPFDEHHASTSARPVLVSPPPDPIEDASQKEPDDHDEMFFESTGLLENISELLPVAKRQRVEDWDQRATPRPFVFAPIHPLQQAASQVSNTELTAGTNRPAFRLPPPEPFVPSEPLPSAFSPHRRGQRFVTGGMAAEVQQWIVEITHTTGRRRDSSSMDAFHATILEMSDAADNDMALVKAQCDRGPLNLLLAESGKHSKSPSLRHGDVIVVRTPFWQVSVAGEAWIVAADWRMAS